MVKIIIAVQYRDEANGSQETIHVRVFWTVEGVGGAPWVWSLK